MVQHFFNKVSLRTDTLLRFTLHFTPLGISFSPIVTQPFVFLVFQTINLGHD